MWSAQHVARDQVRRQADVLDIPTVEKAITEAAVRERESAEQSRRGGSFSEFETDPERLADIWAAKHAEWRRVRDLMVAASWGAYGPEGDTQGSKWAQDRAKQRENALAEAAAFTARRREEADELRMELWLSAAPSRLIRTVAECAGLQPAQVLAQLAERIVVSEDGSVSVPPFSPNL
ncbi:hypothetical protein AB0P45_05785 [Streptomyces niveus]|uniref:hypothetical protein n=1 Tax=Streptomyces niveus TaxID=193462 RepID=UPI00344099D9